MADGRFADNLDISPTRNFVDRQFAARDKFDRNYTTVNRLIGYVVKCISPLFNKLSVKLLKKLHRVGATGDIKQFSF